MQYCVTISGVILSCLIGLALLGHQRVLDGILVAGIGSLLSWISSLLLYGFAELIENTAEIKRILKRVQNKTNKE
ncbi:MAG: hypothetical protein IIX01_02075 [Clostridia bacterium]|nr:hypothetical protein [Clostridia bacterium]